MDWQTIVIGGGILALLALALYRMATGKGNWVCGCGTGACGRPVARHQDEDEKLSGDETPGGVLSEEDVEKIDARLRGETPQEATPEETKNQDSSN